MLEFDVRSYTSIDLTEFDINPQLGIFIHKKASIGNNCEIEPGAFIEEGVKVGDNVFLGRNVRLRKDTEIGDNCKILDQTIIYPETLVGPSCKILEMCHLGRALEMAGKITRTLKTSYSRLQIGEGCLLGPSCRIYRGTEIGARSSIYEFATVREQCILGIKVVLSPGVTVNYETLIGDGTRAEPSVHLTGNMIIGKNVFFWSSRSNCK